MRARGSDVNDKRRMHEVRPHKRTCDKCGMQSLQPDGSWVPMRRNHKNGDYTDNDPSNIERLCPNCDSKELTSCKINGSTFRRPSYHELRELLLKNTIGEVAKQLDGTYNAVKWWMVEFGLEEFYSLVVEFREATLEKVQSAIDRINSLEYQDENWSINS